MITKDHCLYCEVETKEDDKHFISDCCGIGMCTECRDNLVGTDEQIQLDYWDIEEEEKENNETLKINSWEEVDYICFECFDTAKAIYEVTGHSFKELCEHLIEDDYRVVADSLTDICDSLGIDLKFYVINDDEDSIVAVTGNIIQSFNVVNDIKGIDNIRDFKNYLDELRYID